MKFVMDFDNSIFKVFDKSGDLVFECQGDGKVYVFCNFLKDCFSGDDSGMKGVDNDD